jgi:hypothetical protein
MTAREVFGLVVLFVLFGGKGKGGGRGGGGKQLPAGPAVAQVGTGGSSWVQTRYAAAFDAVGKLLPQIDASDLHEIAVSVVALWALETAYGKAEWNFNVGNVVNVGSQAYFINAGDGRSYAAYPTLADAVDAWASLIRGRYQNAAVQLIENPTSDAWVTLLGQGGYYEANVLTYVKGYDGARVIVAALLSGNAPKGTGPSSSSSSSSSTSPVIPIKGVKPKSSTSTPAGPNVTATPSGGALSASGKRWSAIGQTAGSTVKLLGPSSVWAGRPSVTSQPADVNTYLSNMPGGTSKWTMSPVFAYPEMGWSFNGDTATASYQLSPGDNVTWTAKSDGSWTYEHTYGGVTQFVDQLASDLASALPVAFDLAGFAFAGMFVHVVEAVANGSSLQTLGQALASDWQATSNAAQLAFNLMDGDWQNAWNHATEYGKDLSGIVQAFAPGAAPDENGRLTITQASDQAQSLEQEAGDA